jgi:hypothetical protein
MLPHFQQTDMSVSVLVRIAATHLMLLAAMTASGVDCLEMPTADEHNGLSEIENTEPVCTSVLNVLNDHYKHCEAHIDRFAFPVRGRSELALLKWRIIPLFDRRGHEISSTFAELERQIRGQVRSGAAWWELKAREDREVKQVLENVRSSNRTSHPMKFSRTTIHVEDNPKAEIAYRLVRENWEESRIDSRIPPQFALRDHYLFMERDANWLADGHDGVGRPTDSAVTFGGPDLFLYRGVVYTLSWNSDTSVSVHKPVYIVPTRNDLGFDKVLLGRDICLFKSILNSNLATKPKE